MIWVFFCLFWFLCLFNIKAILEEEQELYYLTHTHGGMEDKEGHTFPKGSKSRPLA